jgi:hypothetical protein
MRSRLLTPVFALAAASGLAACSSYDGYGYGGVSLGYGSAGYYDPWYDPYWDHYNSYPYWGWYDGYYYPGSGILIYDRWRRPFRWSDRHRRYWFDRRSHWDRRGHWNGGSEWRDNWRDFRRGDRRDFRRDRRDDRRDFRRDRRFDRDDPGRWRRRD